MELGDQEAWGHEADLLAWGEAGCNGTPEEAVRDVERIPRTTCPDTKREFFIVCGFRPPNWT